MSSWLPHNNQNACTSVYQLRLVWYFYRQNLRAVKEGRVAIVDGNQMFARPGPRLVDALEFLVGLLHNRPDVIPADFPWTWWDTQKTTARPEGGSKVRSADTNGKASNKAAKDSSQAPNGSSCDSENISKHVPNGSSSSSVVVAACHGTASNSIAFPEGAQSQDHANEPSSQKPTTAERAGSNAGQQAEVKKSALQSGAQGSSKETAEECETSGVQDGGRAGQQAGEREWGAAPFLGAEIEEAHAAAIHAGQPTYTDPATGYKVALCCDVFCMLPLTHVLSHVLLHHHM